VAIVALVASLDIGLSQWSLEYIQVALYTITKSTSIVFILFFAILFNLEKKHWSLIVIVLTISGGLIMFTYKSTDFSLIGVLMVLSASFLSGIRWTFSQLIMQKSKLGLHNPLDMVYHVQPLMILTLLPFVLVIEGVSIASSVAGFRYTNLSQLWETVSLVTAGGIIAFLMEVSEFMLVTFTSSLTLTIAGTVKEVISLALAVVFQTTELSPVNWLGMVVCLTGVGLHVFRKAVTMEGTEGVEARRKYRSKSGATTDISIPLLSSESDSSDEINHVTGHRPQPQDHNLLQDHRQWTSVRDNHIKAGLDSPDKDDFSALQEADQIINQLDLMNSSEEMS
jgi:solute carrier family 35 protein C2